MKYRIIKHSFGEQIWFTVKIRRFLFWFDVKEYNNTLYFPGDDIILSKIVKFKSVDEADEYIKRKYSKQINSIIVEGNL